MKKASEISVFKETEETEVMEVAEAAEATEAAEAEAEAPSADTAALTATGDEEVPMDDMQEDAQASTQNADTGSARPAPAARALSGASREEEAMNAQAQSEATRWHYFEQAAFDRDPMRRPVLFGELIGAKRIRIGDASGLFGGVLYQSERLVAPAIVYIPGKDLVLRDYGDSRRDLENAINAMIGAHIPFIVTDVIRENDLILASRRLAMEKRQIVFYRNKHDGRAMVQEGRLVDANVMAVTPYTITLEVFGVETKANRKDFDWGWSASLTDDYEVGDIVRVKVIGVTETEDKIKVLVTHRIEEENPDMSALNSLTVNLNQLGEVTGFTNGVYYVRLYCGANAVVHRVRNDVGCMIGDRVLVRITGKEQERCRARGEIVKVYKRI